MPKIGEPAVLDDFPLMAEKVVKYLEKINVVHPKNVSQLQPTPSPLSLSLLKNQSSPI